MASLDVAHIWLRRGGWNGSYQLDMLSAEGITPFLVSSGIAQGKPYSLIANKGKSFKGVFVLGTGFMIEPDEAQALLAKDPRNQDVIFPFLNGEDLNRRPDQSPRRWIINFQDWPLERAETYIDCMKIVRERVKPERDRQGLKADASAQGYARLWWQYGRRGLDLYVTIAKMKRVLVCSIVTKYLSFCFVPAQYVYMDKLGVFPFDHSQYLALLNSNLYEIWAREYSGTLGTTLQYTPTDSFENFPFPNNLQELETLGEHYHQYRQSIMLSRQEGLTKTYNRFHDPQETAEDITQLRALHKEMDEAVARAYGWDDLNLGHGFHETKQGVRYTISEAARREVLGRLLRLNHERYAEEVALGLHEKGAKKGKGKSKMNGKMKENVTGKEQDMVEATTYQDQLF